MSRCFNFSLLSFSHLTTSVSRPSKDFDNKKEEGKKRQEKGKKMREKSLFFQQNKSNILDGSVSDLS